MLNLPGYEPNESAPVAGADEVSPAADDGAFASAKPGHDDLLRRVIFWYKAANDHWKEFRQEAAEMFDLRAGHQWSAEDLQILADQMRPAITFNRVGPFVDAVGGIEINNRQDIVYLPRQVQASGVTDLFTSAAQWIRQECDAEDEETEAFLDAVTCGWAWTQTRMDYDADPDGIPVIERIDPLEMYPDPSARKQNLADRRYHLRVKDIPRAAAEELFPDVDRTLLHARWAEDGADSARQPHNARLAPFYRIDQADNTDRQDSLVRMAEVEWWDWETAYRVLDPTSGRFVLMGAEQTARYRVRASALGISVDPIRDKRRKYWKAIVGAEVLTVVDGPDKGGFQYKCITGKRDQMRGTWYGIVRAMKDPQMWGNKWLSQGLHIMNVNAKGGLIAETDAFEDPDEAANSWADSDAITFVNPGKIDKVVPKQPPVFPPQLNAMMEMAVNAIPSVSGINMEIMGQSTSQQPQVALLEAGRRQQAMNVLAALFNAKRRYHKEQGRLLLWMIQTYVSDGRLIRVGGPEQKQYVPLVHEPGAAEYDVIVDDAPTSPNMKDRVWGALMQLFPMLRGMPIPPQFYINALKYSPAPASFVEETQKILSQPPPPNAQMQSQAALNQSRAQLHQAQAQKTMADARKSLVETQILPGSASLDVDERRAKIEATRAQAAAALSKAGIDADDARFQQTMAAVDALLRVHGAAMDHVSAMQSQAQPDTQGQGQ